MSSAEHELPVIGPLITGPILVGVTINWFLYGILTMQYYIYLTHADRDKKFLRWIVHFLFLLDTAQTIMTMADAFYWFVYNFGDYSKLADLHLSGINGPFVDAITAFLVQLVYCWRVWVLGKWRVIPAAAAFLALVALVNGAIIGIHDLIIKTVFEITPVFRVTDYLWLFCSATSDVIIACSMTYLLLKFKKSSNTSKSTAETIKRILVFTLETNAVTAAVAISIVLFFLIKPIAPPMTNAYLAGGYLLGKAYTNCFMVLLNQRLSYEASSRGRGTNDGPGADNAGAWSQHSVANNHLGRPHGSPPNQVEVEVSVIQFRDSSRVDHKYPSSETMEMKDWTKGV